MPSDASSGLLTFGGQSCRNTTGHIAICKKLAGRPCETVDEPKVRPTNLKEAGPMSVAENKKIVCDYVAAWNRGDLDAMADFWDKNMIHHARQRSHNRTAVKKIVADFMVAFPDLQFDILDIFGEEDRVLTRMKARGTHNGWYLGYPPTRKKVDCAVMGVSRVANGKIV